MTTPASTTTGAEALRPRFHFTARRGWLNDPNGLFFHAGTYHLFFQHDPDPGGRAGENMHWGHAVSTDLMEWTERPVALFPDAGFGQKYSGGAVVDRDNDSGLQEGSQPPILLFHTAVGPRGFVQCLAYSVDGGESFRQHDRNPLLPELVPGNRDPRVFRHDASRQWVMALWAEPGFAFFGSRNLLDWNRLGDIPGFYECPDCFPLSCIDDPGCRRWILVDGTGDYRIGDFDGVTFVPETPMLPGDCGPNFYATQTWTDLPDGRVVQIAWMRGGRHPGMPFSQQMSFPCELSLHRTPEGLRLHRWPVREIERRRQASKTVKAGPLPCRMAVPEDLLDVELRLDVGSAERLAIVLHGLAIECRPGPGIVAFAGREGRLPPDHGKIALRLLLDRTSLEIFGGDGALSMSACFLPDGQDRDLRIEAEGGPASLDSAIIHGLRPTGLENNP